MEKRYQVFISSTFMDLKNARQEVSQALLRADCFPAGMELFPAADEEQFEFIKTIIDQSDYYILISAGRYGSIHPETGLSYTEMEYDYAVEIGKPVIRLLHKDPFNELKGEFIEKTDNGKEGLRLFRGKLTSGSLVKFWSSPEQLSAETLFALQDIKKRKPAIGWVPATGRANDEAELEIYKLKEELSKLKSDGSIQNQLQIHLPVTKALVNKFPDGYNDNFLSDLTSLLRKFFKRPTSRVAHQLQDSLSNLNSFSNHKLTDEDAKNLIDALVLDGCLDAESEHMIRLSKDGRKLLTKSRLLALDLS